MSKYQKSIVASGHKLVSSAAGEILSAGGNAFDAVVAAGFAAAVVEPALTSLGGGGLMLGHSEKRGENIFFDFFVDSPGRGLKNKPNHPDFFPLTIDFIGSTQVFNVGLGSVAVPGTLRGLLHIHTHLGHMPLLDVLTPAREFAKGHILNHQQGHFMQILKPIMTLTRRGKMLYEPDGNYICEGQELINGAVVEFFDQLIHEGDESFYKGEIASKIAAEMKNSGGLLTATDLAGYKVYERPPLSMPYQGYTFLTSPEPSMGGTLIGLSLLLGEGKESVDFEWGGEKYLLSSVALMQKVEELRERGITTPMALRDYISDPDPKTSATKKKNQPEFSRGTTHISVADADGNCASMTCSNGEGSGYFAPGTGVMLNNMMGEDDLHPDGFHAGEPGERVRSMMSPSLLMQNDQVRLVLGSGGSKRIRTAVAQVLNQVVVFEKPLQDSVDAPRVYLDEDCLQMEPGFSDRAMASLENVIPINLWQQKDVYFGGVHAVVPGEEGVGDPRRGGTVVEIPCQDKS